MRKIRIVNKTDFPAKHESWMVEKGWVYNFSEVGETTPNAPVIPATHAFGMGYNVDFFTSLFFNYISYTLCQLPSAVCYPVSYTHLP